jgi:galactonate dehydratase
LSKLSGAIQNSTTPYQRPKLKITDVRTAEIKAHGYQVHVRVYTDQGIFGHGEATDAAHGAVSLINAFRSFLIGKDPLNVDFLFENLRALGVFAGAQGGQYVTALTGLEIALWDLAGKALGLPVYQLLGGKMRERIRLYCDTASPTPRDPAAHEGFQKVKDLGFTALKIDCDEQHSPRSWDTVLPFDWGAPFAPVKVNLSASNAEID